MQMKTSLMFLVSPSSVAIRTGITEQEAVAEWSQCITAWDQSAEGIWKAAFAGKYAYVLS